MEASARRIYWVREGDETVGQIRAPGGPDGRTRILKHCHSFALGCGWAGHGHCFGLPHKPWSGLCNSQHKTNSVVGTIEKTTRYTDEQKGA